ncbi:MAG: alpha/beta hydrolase [Proteobacteria bacterium]|nr:alpha/beta hydrolase [Pseudomonadota bacterium]
MEYIAGIGTQKQKHPMLFLHGAYCDSRVWKEHFVNYFVEKGFDCYLIDFKAEDISFTMKPTTLNTYVDQVLKIINEIGEAPIVVAHSMAAAVMQKLYQQTSMKFPAWVLMTPAPPRSFYESSQEMLLNNPTLFSQMYMLQLMGKSFVTPSLAKLALFSDDFDEKKAMSFLSMASDMPGSLVFDMMMMNIPDKDLQVKFPVMIQAAKQDRLVSANNLRLTEKTFKVKAKYYNSGHAIMLDKEWKRAADDIAKFIGSIKN